MALRWNDELQTLNLGLRDVMDVSARHVDRGLALSTRGRLGAGNVLHRVLQHQRGAIDDAYQSEVTLRWTRVVRGWTCTVSGRVDGLSVESDRTIVEEIKSTGLGADALDAVDHFEAWEEQLRLYVFFAAEARHPDPIGRLRVASLVDGSQRQWHVGLDATLRETLDRRLDRLVREREAWLFWQRVRRDGTVYAAHPELRAGQQAMADAAERAVDGGRHLLLTAPTGAGKTAAVMYGVLRAAARANLGVYWATARGTQQAMAERVLTAMQSAGTPLRAVVLRAREKVCLNSVVDCRAEACRFAAGYRDRLDAGTALDDLTAIGFISPDGIRARADVDVLCPYELAIDFARVVDVVIGDYNQCFDPDFQIRRVFGEREWIFVVDEAHQLPDRASGHGSPALTLASAEAACEATLQAGLVSVSRLAADIRQAIVEAGLRGPPGSDGDAEVQVELPLTAWVHLRDRVDELAFDHASVRDLADPDAPDDAWLVLARSLTRFVDTLERAGEETVVLWSLAGLKLCCRDPSRILGPRFAEARASVLMSATLAPSWFVRDRCGLALDRVDELAVGSGFPTENRLVVVVPGVSTAWKDRERARPTLVRLIEASVAAVPGNVAVYFASYATMRDLIGACTFPGRVCRVQSPDATDTERAELLAELAGPERTVLAAVLGGVYAEGIDLPGGSLLAAIIVGPALPPPSIERALTQQWFNDRYDQGFELAYVHPGMTKVVQAAGRVVRSAEDRGAVVLICQRFLRTTYAAFLPEDWTVVKSSRPWVALQSFFATGGPA